MTGFISLELLVALTTVSVYWKDARNRIATSDAWPRVDVRSTGCRSEVAKT